MSNVPEITDENERWVKNIYPNAEIDTYKFYGLTIDYTVFDGSTPLGASAFNIADAWKYARQRIENALHQQSR